MTSRGMGEEDFKRIAGYIDASIKVCKSVQADLPKEVNKLKDFKAKVASGEVEEIKTLKAEIAQWASTFPLPI